MVLNTYASSDIERVFEKLELISFFLTEQKLDLSAMLTRNQIAVLEMKRSKNMTSRDISFKAGEFSSEDFERIYGIKRGRRNVSHDRVLSLEAATNKGTSLHGIMFSFQKNKKDDPGIEIYYTMSLCNLSRYLEGIIANQGKISLDELHKRLDDGIAFLKSMRNLS